MALQVGPSGARRARSCARRVCTAALCGLLCAGLPVHAQGEAPPTAAEVDKQPNWLVQQIRRFRSHPHLDRGYRLKQAGRLEEARAAMARALEMDPGNAQARSDYVALLERLGVYEEVLLHSEPLLKDPDRRVHALFAQARAYHALGRLEDASAALKQVVGTSDVETAKRLNAADELADLLIRCGRYEEALQTLALLPGGFRVHLRRGIAKEALGRHDEAEQAFRAALAQAGDSGERVQALEYLGQNAIRRKDWSAARAHYDAALSLDPANVRLMRALVQAAHGAGHTRQALRWAGEVVAREPTSADREVLANLRYATRDYPGAVRDYQALLNETADPAQRARLLAAIGYAYFDMGRYAESARAFEEAVQLGDEPRLRGALQAAREAERDPLSEMEVLQAALRHKPTAEAHLRLAALYLERGDEDAAIAHLEQAVRFRQAPRVRAAAYRQLWPLYYAREDLGEARRALEQLTALVPHDAETWRALAHIHFERQDVVAAAECLRRSIEAAPSVEAYRSLAYALATLGAWEEAVRVNRAWLAMPDLPASDRAEAYERLAIAQTEAGDRTGLVHTLQEAIANGIDNRLMRERLGLALFAERRWREALPHFRALYQREPDAMAALYLSRCYAAMGKTGLAVHFGRLALGGAEDLPEAERRQLQTELAYLYADESEYAAAARMWAAVIARDGDPLHVHRYAVAQHRAGNVEEARKAWRSIADGALPREEEVERLNQLATFAAAEGDLTEAVRLYAQADALAPGAYNQYRMGLALQELGRREEALRAFETAYRREPTAAYALALGYAYVNAKRYAEAAPILERASALDPDNLRLYQDIAYAYLHSLQNDKAIAWFKKGIDARLRAREEAGQAAKMDADRRPGARREDMHGAGTDTSIRLAALDDQAVSPRETDAVSGHTALALATPSARYGALVQSAPAAGLPQHADPELERMRDEVARLEKNWNFTFYQAYSPGHEGTDPGVPSTGGSVVPSQGGVEISYRPPVVGFRDERIFDIYGRVLWSNRPRSLDMESDSLQGGIGLRYKPFRALQLYVSGEKLFRIGDNAQNDWLFRLSYGWTDIHDRKFGGETDWNYSSLYLDAGIFTDEDHTRAFYGELRQGRTFKLGEQWLLTPHLVVNGRYEHPNFSPGSYWQAGAGLSLKFLFNATRYASYRSNIELLLHYKVGMAHVASGWLFTVVARL